MSLWCDAEVHDAKTFDGRPKKRDSSESSKHDGEDVDEHYKTLMDKHGDTAFLSEGCGPKQFTVAPMTAMKPRLHCLCSTKTMLIDYKVNKN